MNERDEEKVLLRADLQAAEYARDLYHAALRLLATWYLEERYGLEYLDSGPTSARACVDELIKENLAKADDPEVVKRVMGEGSGDGTD